MVNGSIRAPLMMAFFHSFIHYAHVQLRVNVLRLTSISCSETKNLRNWIPHLMIHLVCFKPAFWNRSEWMRRKYTFFFLKNIQHSRLHNYMCHFFPQVCSDQARKWVRQPCVLHSLSSKNYLDTLMFSLTGNNAKFWETELSFEFIVTWFKREIILIKMLITVVKIDKEQNRSDRWDVYEKVEYLLNKEVEKVI